MIIELPSRTMALEGSTEDLVLDGLIGFWRAKRGLGPAPLADELYLSDLARDMAYVLLCFRDGDAYRIEFAGCEVQDLLDFDPTGEVLRREDSDPILAALAGRAEAECGPEPQCLRGDYWRALLLPYVNGAAGVTVLLIGVVPALIPRSAEILAFKPSAAD